MNENDNVCIGCNKKTSITINHMYFCDDCKKSQSLALRQFDDNKTTFYPEIDEITEKLYLGNEDGGREKEKLKEFGVTHILLCGTDLVERYPKDFIYKQLYIDDSLEQNLTQYFTETFNFIDNAQKIYVHCAAGVSRSASIVIAYLIMKRKISFKEAYDHVKKRRKVIHPNGNFVDQLKKLELEVL